MNAVRWCLPETWRYLATLEGQVDEADRLCRPELTVDRDRRAGTPPKAMGSMGFEEALLILNLPETRKRRIHSPEILSVGIQRDVDPVLLIASISEPALNVSAHCVSQS